MNQKLIALEKLIDTIHGLKQVLSLQALKPKTVMQPQVLPSKQPDQH